MRRLLGLGIASLLAAIFLLPSTRAQVLDFESGGLKYKAQTRGGMTIMFAALPSRILGYAILQVAVSNGSVIDWVVQPEDMTFVRPDGTTVRATPARGVITDVFQRAGGADVGRLVAVYEAALYGNTQVRITNGYEMRRRDMMGVGGARLRAAATASAIVMATTKLAPGQSTDGAVFFPNQGKPLGVGVLLVDAAGEKFEFPLSDLPPMP